MLLNCRETIQFEDSFERKILEKLGQPAVFKIMETKAKEEDPGPTDAAGIRTQEKNETRTQRKRRSTSNILAA